MIFYMCADTEWDDEKNDYIPTSKYTESTKVKGYRIDRRCCDEPVKIPAYNGNKKKADADWYNEGKNHRVVNGYIERDFDDEFYIIEINTLEDLLNFQDKYKVTASVSRRKSGYIYNGVELDTFYADYLME
jgi:hypothetical protein